MLEKNELVKWNIKLIIWLEILEDIIEAKIHLQYYVTLSLFLLTMIYLEWSYKVQVDLQKLRWNFVARSWRIFLCDLIKYQTGIRFQAFSYRLQPENLRLWGSCIFSEQENVRFSNRFDIRFQNLAFLYRFWKRFWRRNHKVL